MERKQIATPPDGVHASDAVDAVHFEQIILHRLATADTGKPGLSHEEVFQRLRERLTVKEVPEYD